MMMTVIKVIKNQPPLLDTRIFGQNILFLLRLINKMLCKSFFFRKQKRKSLFLSTQIFANLKKISF